VYIADIAASAESIPRVTGDDQFTRVKIFGTVMSKRVFRGEGKVDYAVLAVDDGSGFMIRVKAWGIGTATVGKIEEGDVIDVIGRVRYKDEEAYVVPEIVRKIEDLNWETVRELEVILDHIRRSRMRSLGSGKSGLPCLDLESRILDTVESTGGDIGIEYNELIKRIEHSSEDEIKKALKELLDQGKICEPRPGRYRR
jgi:hypothetical protein